MTEPSVPVHVGFTWTSGLLALANLLIGGVFVALIKTRPALKKIANEREANLLTERAAEMEAMRAELAAVRADMERQRAMHEAERALDRHRLNNFDQCFNALFMMFETSPEKAAEAIAAVKSMRARQMEAEALEKATIHAAAIKQTEPKA